MECKPSIRILSIAKPATFHRHARPLVDTEGRIFLVLVGQPDRPSYRTAAAAAYDFIKTHGQAAAFPAEMRHHRRGLFAAINVGLTFGKGQMLPTWLDNKQYTGLADQLLGNKDITRMATFASGAPCLLSSISNSNSRQPPSNFGRRNYTTTTSNTTANSLSASLTFTAPSPSPCFLAQPSILGAAYGPTGIAISATCHSVCAQCKRSEILTPSKAGIWSFGI